MAALAKLLLILFVVLTVIYVSLSLYSRSVRRGKLEREWDEEMSRQQREAFARSDLDGADTASQDPSARAIGEAERDAFIRDGLEDYDHSLRRKLILGVYVVPVVLIGTIIYFVNIK